MKNVAVLTKNGAFALFFVPTAGDLTAQEPPPPGICIAIQGEKNANAQGWGEGVGVFGGWAAGFD